MNGQTNIGHADKVIIDQSRSASVLPVPQQIPQYPRDFTGRDEDIKGLLDRFGNGATITGLRGMGGVGKTALALVLADRLKDRFPDGRLYLEMQGTSKNPLKSEEAMAHIIRSYLGLDVKLPADQNGLGGLYRSVLSGKRALILLDNAARRAQVEPLLPPPDCSLLVTSRSKFALPGLTEKDLDVLPLVDAKKLLLEICRRIGEHASELAELCGCLPLALRNAASVLKEKPNMGVARYIERLADARKRLELVEASFDLSYQLLTQEMQKLWCLLSVFPADFDLAGAAAVWEMEPDSAEESLGELVKWSLVEFLPHPKGEGGRYKLHDLARFFAHVHLEPDMYEIAQQRYAKYYQELLRDSRELYLIGGASLIKGLNQFDADWINIQEGQKWTSINITKSFEIAKICSNFAGTGSILGLRLHPVENIKWLKAALEAARLIGDRSAEGVHLGNLGNAYYAIGDFKNAIEYFKQRLAISQEYGDKNGESNALGNLGSAYCALSKFRKALHYHHCALAIDREIGYRRGECSTLGNIGLVHSSLGDAKKAIEYHMDALMIAREIGDRRAEGNSLGNLGIEYKNLGDTRTAIRYYEQQLAVARELIDRSGEGNALGNLGIAHKCLGETKKAIEFSEQQLAIARDLKDRRGEGNALGNLGNVYSVMRDFCRAIEYFKQALVIDREIEDKSGEGIDLGNLGQAYFYLGDPYKAIEYYEQALKIARDIEDRRSEGNHLFNTSLLLEKLGQREKAVGLAAIALAIFEQIESPHADTVRQALAAWQS